MTRRLAAAFLLVMLGEPAQARFLVTDADQIDPEERLGTVTYIDELSYLFPEPYDELWDDHDVGFRASAGSFTVNRFDYLEDVKLQSAVDAPGGVAFFQSRYEDMLEQRTEREVRAWAQLPETPVRLALLGDGGTYKEYGDLGAAVAIWRDRRHWLEASYWAVDLYYEQKKSDEQDSRPRNTTSPGIAGDWTVDPLRLRFSAQVDTPLRWIRRSRGYAYDYARRTAFARLDDDFGGGLDVALSGAYEWKRESKQWLSAGTTTYAKGLERTVGWSDLCVIRVRGRAYDEVGLSLLARNAAYDFTAAPGLSPDQAPEPPSPPSVVRREVGLRGLRFAPLPWKEQSLQYGLYVDGVDLSMVGWSRRQLESKAVFGWDVAFGSDAHLLLNSTWDLAKIARGYPYDTRPFRPWGGGNIQLIAVF